MAGERLKVLICDDDALMRGGMLPFLAGLGMEVLEAGSGHEGLELALREKPDVAVLDIVMPEEPGGPRDFERSIGLEVARKIKAALPTTGIVIFSAYEDRGADVWDLVRSGVKGVVYLLKGALPDELAVAIRSAARGRVSIDGDVDIERTTSAAHGLVEMLSSEERSWVELALQNLEALSAREREVLGLLAESRTVEGVASQLHLAPSTVTNTINSIYSKLGLSGVDESQEYLRKSSVAVKAWLIHRLGSS
jgi:DNA-binding NarL/FixJ family response regulator